MEQAKPAVAQAKPAAQQKTQQKPGAAPSFGGYKKDYGKDFRGIVRISGKELNGEMPIERGLTRIKGIGVNFGKNIAGAIERELGIARSKLIGLLSDEEIAKIEEVLRVPEKHIKKAYLFNRPVDFETGNAKHLIANDLIFATRQDVQFQKDIHTWKGWRHSVGQRVRGQHSRTTGRTGISVGVLKKALKQQKAAGAAKAQESSAPAKEKK